MILTIQMIWRYVVCIAVLMLSTLIVAFMISDRVLSQSSMMNPALSILKNVYSERCSLSVNQFQDTLKLNQLPFTLQKQEQQLMLKSQLSNRQLNRYLHLFFLHGCKPKAFKFNRLVQRCMR